MANPTIPTLESFKKDTSAGLFASRSADLKAMDTAIEKYHKATNDYGRKFEAESLRIALDQLKSNSSSKEFSARDKNGILTALDSALPAQKAPPTSASSATVQATMENTRKGVLYFLAKSSLSRPLPTQVVDLASETKEFGSSVRELIDTGASGGKELMSQIQSDGFVQPALGADPPATPSGFAATIIEAVKNLIGKLLEHFPGDAASAAADWLLGATPQLVCDMLGSLVAHLGTAVAIGKQVWAACKAAVDLVRTRNLESGILNGTPKIVIESIRDTIEGSLWEAVGKALLEALMAGIAAACPAAGTVASAVKTIIGFVMKAFFYFRELWRMKKIIGPAAQALYDSKLWERAEEFNSWFKDIISGLPIVACYVLGMPMTGSMYGFLSLVSTKGGSEDQEKALTQKALEENAEQLELLKTRARAYIKEHSVRLHSADPVVDLSLKTARGEEVKIL